MDPYASDAFRMFDFKVKKCARGRSHERTDCHFPHPSEKARCWDLIRFHYSGVMCPDFCKWSDCRHGDECSVSFSDDVKLVCKSVASSPTSTLSVIAATITFSLSTTLPCRDRPRRDFTFVPLLEVGTKGYSSESSED
ncbi:hypothetical protein AMTR_s00069p00198010 [Amborella trichopoda]|uniref:AtC3H23-like CCCH zinc finger domain-containing protein n=1 Tax=Amborella trichopoda TaxID=13333 RepID=U5DB89_AMBTC|nr:hypothetical protein AMTR_s00069p00198010 [Amborella trichopoda]